MQGLTQYQGFVFPDSKDVRDGISSNHGIIELPETVVTSENISAMQGMVMVFLITCWSGSKWTPLSYHRNVNSSHRYSTITHSLTVTLHLKFNNIYPFTEYFVYSKCNIKLLKIPLPYLA
jgi:hypothetical protein